MTVPSKADLEKRKKKLAGFNKKIGDDGKMTEKALCSAMRSAIRSLWLKHDVKLSFLYENTIPDMNPDTKTKWLYKCEYCGGLFKQSDIQIDHRKGEHPLNTLEDILPFAQSILGVTKEDLAITCIDCHAVKTYSERYGMSLEDAKKEKAIIAKTNQTVTIQKKELLAAGFKAAEISNEEKRRECYRALLKDLKEKQNDSNQ